MIFVARTATPASLDLADATSAGARELAEATARAAARDLPAGSFYKAYKGDDVKAALLTLFKGKCAYCESAIAGGQDVDVEHYRPKGGVKDAASAGIDHPGYWWLAMEYRNLLASCQHCNQSRRQVIIDANATEAEIAAALAAARTTTTGKLDYFPTADATWITEPAADVAVEQPLLLNPTEVDPAAHLDYVFHDTLVTQVPRGASQAGQVTIDVLGLNRRYLTEARMKKVMLMLALRNNIRETLAELDDAQSDAMRDMILRFLQRDIEALDAHCTEDQPFSAMACALFDQIQAEVAAIIA